MAGPITIELTASMIRCYKSCPRRYELEYIEMLKPEEKIEALEIGSNYHTRIEALLKGKEWNRDGVIGKMVEAFDRFVPWRSWEIAGVEEEFRVRIGRGVYLIGKMDGIMADGTPIEHKTSGVAVDEKYIDRLAWDDQVSVYLLALSLMRGTPVTRVVYTVCQKPTIRLKQNETEEQYLERVGQWYDETKVRVLTVVRRPEELEEKRKEIVNLAREIRGRKHFWRNPSACSIVNCPYAPICLNYDPSLIVGFVKKERRNEELCKF